MSFVQDIDIIYKDYIDLDVKQIDKYMLNIFEKYHISSIDYVISMICEYSSRLGKEEYQKYQEKQKKIRAYHIGIIELVDKYIKTNSQQVIFELLKYNDIDSLNTYLQLYLNIKPKRQLEVECLKEQLNKMNQNLNKFDMYKKYLEDNNSDQNIIKLITLILCGDEEKALFLLKEYQILEEEYHRSLDKFKKLFPNQENDFKYLKIIFERYYSYDKKLNVPIIKKDIELMKDIFTSNYSVLEYLSYNGGYTIGKIDKIFSKIRSLDIPEYKKILAILSNRSNEKIFKYLDNLVLEIYNQEKFELMDYYNYTKLGIDYFRKYVLEHTQDSQIKKDVLHKLNLIWNFSRRHAQISENSINGISIIKGVIVSVEEKQRIYNYLKENGIPLVDTTFTYYVRKYANGEFELPNKII